MTRDAFLTQARARFKQAEEADEHQRKREIEALRFYAGEQWDSDILKSRQGMNLGSGTTSQTVPARPSLTINKTREPVRQVLNQERQSDLGIELIPADDWGELAGPIDHTEIELREGLVRRIQRDSEATDARTWAFARSAIAGRGYWGVMTRFVPGKFDQEVYVERFYNQSAVLIDPAHEQPDGSDMRWAFVGVDMPYEQYKAEYPDSDVSSATDEDWRAFGQEAPDWFLSDGETRSVRVMNYWYTERTTRTLYQLADGRGVYQDELPPAGPERDALLAKDEKGKPISRDDVQKQVKWAKINGTEVLDETDWPGHYIPIIKEVGEELQPYDKERRCEGIVAPMMDPCKGNNYIISKFVEQVGLTPIPPWMMAAGQDEGFEAEYAASTTRTLPILHYNQKDSFGMPAGPPSRTNVTTDVAAIATGVQIFGQAIASTSVVPETALGNVDSTVKSGRLAKMLIDQANRGTSNFLDNHVRSMRHEARIINDLLYPIYGTRPGRLLRMMNPHGEMSTVPIGQPMQEGQMPPGTPTQATGDNGQPKVFKLTKDAEFNVAIKISKSYDTRREQEAETLGQIISADPAQMGVIGDLFFKYQDGPGHEEMSERYKAMLLPPVQALVAGKQAPSPEVMAAQQQMQELGQELQKLQAEKQGKVVESQAALQKATIESQAETERLMMELASKEQLARLKAETDLALEQMKIQFQTASLVFEAERARVGLQTEQGHDLLTQELDAQRSQDQLAQQQAHDAEQAGLSRGHEAEMSQAGHQQALEQMGEQAALTPEPEPQANA